MMRQSSSGGTLTRSLASPGTPPTRKSRARTVKWLSSMSFLMSFLFAEHFSYLFTILGVFGVSFFEGFFLFFFLN